MTVFQPPPPKQTTTHFTNLIPVFFFFFWKNVHCGSQDLVHPLSKSWPILDLHPQVLRSQEPCTLEEWGSRPRKTLSGFKYFFDRLKPPTRICCGQCGWRKVIQFDLLKIISLEVCGFFHPAMGFWNHGCWFFVSEAMSTAKCFSWTCRPRGLKQCENSWRHPRSWRWWRLLKMMSIGVRFLVKNQNVKIYEDILVI